MDYPTIWGHNCSWYHHIFNFFVLNTLSILSRILLLILDWKVLYNKKNPSTKYKNVILPAISYQNVIENNKNIIMVSSHTTNWDGIIGYLFFLSEKLPAFGAAKYELFWGPFSHILRYLGFIPIYWDKKTNATEQIFEYFDINNKKNNKNLFLGIFPEGNRYKDRWKSGFWVISRKLNCKILTVGFDYEKRYVVPNSIIMPTDDFNNDINVIKEQLYPFIPLYPEYTDIETRYNHKRNLYVTSNVDIIDIPRKDDDNNEIYLSAYNLGRICKILLIFSIFPFYLRFKELII
jgi:1-acyl-sn-glycerol-3-phosphate acyltransferase